MEEKKLFSKAKHLRIIIILCMLTMMIFEAIIQIHGNILSSIKTINILLDQIVRTADKNHTADENLKLSLKEDYIIRAKSVAYVVKNIPGIENDIKELQKITELLSVDEIHFFNKQGIIYGGSVPKYYGVGMDSGEQIGFFKPMLTDTSLTLCQDVTPNTADGTMMMYAMVWRNDLSGLVQVGIKPKRLLKEMKSHEMSEYVNSIPVIEGETICIADTETNIICGSTISKDIGKNLTDLGFPLKDIHSATTHIKKIQGEYILYKFVKYNDYFIGVEYNLEQANKGLSTTLFVIFIYLFVAATIITKFVSQLEILNKDKLALSVTSNTDELTGLFNKRAFHQDSMIMKKEGLPENFIMLSMDINGLKDVNDTLGHAAGDELITGASACMKSTFGSYGKIYRTGGDEFIALLQIPDDILSEIQDEFVEKVNTWQGTLVNHLSISTGYVYKKEVEYMIFEEVEKLADNRMYEAKRKYYSIRGKDRRSSST